MTIILWAWKYGRNLQADVTNAKASFFMFGYLVFASVTNLLV